MSYDQAIDINKTNIEKKYYAHTAKQEITANTTLNYRISKVFRQQIHGEAILRLGIGRAHHLSKTPVVEVNGVKVDVPVDFRGYDQRSRDSFFGVIEIPVPYELLRNNNTVNITFADNGGAVSSLALQVIESEQAITRVH